MNSDIFWRLVWKEYRQQQSLWIAIALAGLILQGATLIFCSLNGLDVPDRLFTVALSLPILYSLGCGATLFAGEHEAGTYAFQQSLPVAAKRVFFAKTMFAVTSALLLFPMMWLIAYGMTSWTLPSQNWHLQLWSGGLVATLEVMAWAILGSLLLRRVLPAAIASGVIAVVVGYASLILLVAFGGRLVEFNGQDYIGTIPVRLCFAALAFAIATKLGAQWFSERPGQWRANVANRRRSRAATGRTGAPLRRTVLLRLMWHEWRQARPTILWCVGGHFVAATWFAMTELGSEAYILFLPALATFFGASVFAADQRQQQYKFFSEHGIRPRFVWLSRQAVWGAVLTALTMAAIILQFTAGALSDNEKTNLYVAAGFTILMYSSGQLCSILIRSNIVAIFTAAFCSAMLFMWTAFAARLGIMWVICAFPLPLIFLGASWFYAPKWIQQRHTWQVRLVTAASIVIPLIAIVTATGAFRVLEVPAVVLSIEGRLLNDDDSPAARETAAMYRKANQMTSQLVTHDDGSTSIRSRNDNWNRNVELFIKASQRDGCRFHHWNDVDNLRAFDGKSLTRAVVAEAVARIAEGDIEGAAALHNGLLRLASHFYMQHSEATYRMHAAEVEKALFAQLPKWANHKSVTAERVNETLQHLQAWCKNNQPNWEQSILEHRRNVNRLIALDDDIMKNHYEMRSGERGALKAIGILLPWERWRMSRVVDVYTETELQGVKAVRERTPRIAPWSQSQLSWDVELKLTNGSRELLRSSDIEPWVNSTVFVNSVSPLFAPTYVSWEHQLHARRNAVLLQLAAIAWRKQHGDLPASLNELSRNAFDIMPIDPYTKQPFVYMPNGVEEEVWPDETMYGMGFAGEMAAMDQSSDEAAEDKLPKPRLERSDPFLWSPGEQLRYYPQRAGQPGYSPLPREFCDQQGNTLNEVSLLHSGVQYYIPSIADAKPEQPPPDSSDDTEALPTDE